MGLRSESVIPGRFFLSSWDLEWDCGCPAQPASHSPHLPSVSTLGQPQHKVNAYSYRNGDLFRSSQEKLFIMRILLNWNQTGKVDDIKATLEISYFLLFLSLSLFTSFCLSA